MPGRESAFTAVDECDCELTSAKECIFRLAFLGSLTCHGEKCLTLLALVSLHAAISPFSAIVRTILREKLVKIGAKVVTHARYIVFQLTEVAVPRQMFAALRDRIGRLRLAEAAG
jgi:hypothetical protein